MTIDVSTPEGDALVRVDLGRPGPCTIALVALIAVLFDHPGTLPVSPAVVS